MSIHEKIDEIRNIISKIDEIPNKILLYDTKSKEKKLDSLLTDLLNSSDVNQVVKIIPLIYKAATDVESVYIRTGKSSDLSNLYLRLTETFEKTLAKFSGLQNARAIEILLEHYKKLFSIYSNMINTKDQNQLSDRARMRQKMESMTRLSI